MLSTTEIQSALAMERLVVEQDRFLKWEWSCKFQRNCKLIVFISKLQVRNYHLELGLQFSKTFAGSKFEAASC